MGGTGLMVSDHAGHPSSVHDCWCTMLHREKKDLASAGVVVGILS